MDGYILLAGPCSIYNTQLDKTVDDVSLPEACIMSSVAMKASKQKSNIQVSFILNSVSYEQNMWHL